MVIVNCGTIVINKYAHGLLVNNYNEWPTWPTEFTNLDQSVFESVEEKNWMNFQIQVVVSKNFIVILKKGAEKWQVSLLLGVVIIHANFSVVCGTLLNDVKWLLYQWNVEPWNNGTIYLSNLIHQSLCGPMYNGNLPSGFR